MADVTRTDAEEAARPFAGRVAVVTGAAQGIGRAVASLLAERGAAVVIVDVDEPTGRDSAEAIAANGGQVCFEPVDLSVPAQCEQVIDRVLGSWGRVDVLVNNAAALGLRVPFLEMTLEDWQSVQDVNVTAAALLGRDAARNMAGRGSGAIINVTSIQENLPLARHAAYVTSKGGVSALTRAMAVELSPLGIRVNAVAPGVIETPTVVTTRASLPGAGDLPATLLRRYGDSAEVAEVVAFLASDRAAFVTGSVIRVDGGRALSRYPDPLAAAPSVPAPTRRHT